jgi:hypothetical protein
LVLTSLLTTESAIGRTPFESSYNIRTDCSNQFLEQFAALLCGEKCYFGSSATEFLSSVTTELKLSVNLRELAIDFLVSVDPQSVLSWESSLPTSFRAQTATNVYSLNILAWHRSPVLRLLPRTLSIEYPDESRVFDLVREILNCCPVNVNVNSGNAEDLVRLGLDLQIIPVLDEVMQFRRQYDHNQTELDEKNTSLWEVSKLQELLFSLSEDNVYERTEEFKAIWFEDTKRIDKFTTHFLVVARTRITIVRLLAELASLLPGEYFIGYLIRRIFGPRASDYCALVFNLVERGLIGRSFVAKRCFQAVLSVQSRTK